MNAQKTKLRLTDKRPNLKPYSYDWAWDIWEKHESIHWLPKEVPLHEDINHWKNKLTKDQKNFLLQIFRLFTQGDVNVAGAYVNNYLPVLGGHPEIRSMLLSIAAREAIHVRAYSHLIEQLGLPDKIFNEFLEYDEMAAKQKYFEDIESKDETHIIQQMTAVSAFTEGMQLFSSFAMLLNFGRHGLMPGMVKIVTWSIIDEDLHVEAMSKLFRQFVKENPDVWNDELKSQLYSIAENMVELEDKFLELAFKVGDQENLTLDEMKHYNRYIGNRRLIQLGLKGIFKWNGTIVKKNPLPFVDEMTVLQSHANFFEQSESSYAKGSLTGTWDDVWGSIKEEM